jgi:hypothetical protein
MDVTGSGALKDQASTVAGSAAVAKIDLAKETANEEFADFNPDIGKEKQRWYLLYVIGGLFVVLNGAVIWLIHYAMGIDVGLITAHPDLADKRIITASVFQTLIGATVVQTGAVTWAMARFLFPNQPD